jgi:hypothetical protein
MPADSNQKKIVANVRLEFCTFSGVDFLTDCIFSCISIVSLSMFEVRLCVPRSPAATLARSPLALAASPF